MDGLRPPVPAIVPFTHHEIVGLIAPFARRGLRVDLARTDRLARRLVFAAADHDGPQRREALALDNATTGRFRLTRTLSLADGPECALWVEGTDPAALIDAIEAIPHARQYRLGPGTVVAFGQRLETDGTLRLERGTAEAGGVTLALTMPTYGSRRADLVLTTGPDDAIELPEDLLGVLGRDWSGLDHWQKRRWNGTVRVRGKAVAGDADAEGKLARAARHVAETLAEPPARFHERRRVARWTFAFRTAMPLFTCVALIAAAFAFAKAGVSHDSILRMLVFNAPPLLLVAFFSMRELPRITVPKRPRRSKAPAWRPSAHDPREAG